MQRSQILMRSCILSPLTGTVNNKAAFVFVFNGYGIDFIYEACNGVLCTTIIQHEVQVNLFIWSPLSKPSPKGLSRDILLMSHSVQA